MSGIPVGQFAAGEPDYWIPEDTSHVAVCPLCEAAEAFKPGDADGFDVGYQWDGKYGYVCPSCFEGLAT